ncbi:hypothetical protein GCK32_016858 [Trichostrongylus colubriformis]|uniref:Uncharacterized protein n=1 Tax=Trichostrongylus colubriformis TaxID=6319 RepID=A0AAN8IM00_TRICO
MLLESRKEVEEQSAEWQKEFRGATRSALVPFSEHPRRAGSEADLAYASNPHPHHPYGPPMPPPGARMPPFPMHPPHPHHPHHPMMGFHPPPPHPPPHPQFFRGPFPPPPPPPPPHHMMPPPSMRLPPGVRMPPPPPHMFPMMAPPFAPRGYFMPPPPPHFMGGHPHPYRPTSPGEGPIITGPESIYGTIPRRGAYEEPVYMPGSHVGPPEASYQPANYPTDHYESYYDTYRRKSTKKDGGASSVASRQDSSSVWEQYEAGIYRKPHLNEKAFGGTLKSTAIKETSNTTLNRNGSPELATQTVEANVSRPDTPPVDYEAFENMKIKQHGGNGRTPVY